MYELLNNLTNTLIVTEPERRGYPGAGCGLTEPWLGFGFAESTDTDRAKVHHVSLRDEEIDFVEVVAQTPLGLM